MYTHIDHKQCLNKMLHLEIMDVGSLERWESLKKEQINFVSFSLLWIWGHEMFKLK